MKSAQTREKILAAGLRIFSAKGYLGATTKGIALQAGVAEVTIFRHFSSKERLFEEMMNRYSFLPVLKGLLPGLKDLGYRDALILVARSFLDMLAERKALVRIMHAEIYRSTKINAIFQTFVDEMFRTMAQCFRVFQKKGALRDFNPEYAARAFMGMFLAFFITEEFLRKNPVKGKNRERAVSEFVDIFINGTAKERHDRA
jgi:AcrR family transcriptional regulator